MLKASKLLIIFLLASLICLNNNVNAQQQVEDPLLKQGIANYRAENFDEALKIFTTISQTDPKSSLAAYYLGLTYKRLENYLEAKKYLLESLQLTPKIKGALIELIDTLYRLNEIEEAKKWIKVAEDEGIRPEQTAFLKGLTLLKGNEYEGAVAAFTDAKTINPDLAQSADYQIGIAYLNLKKFNEAKTIFRNLILTDPNTDLAIYAKKYTDAIDKKIEAEKPFHMTLRAGFEYDSNVVLKPADTSIVTQISDKSDTRQVFDVEGDYTFTPKDKNNPLSLRTGYALHISKENDLGAYDNIVNDFSIQPNITLKKAQITFPTHCTYNIVGEKNYLAAFTTGNVNNILYAPAQMAQVGIYYKYEDFLRPLQLKDEDRTGSELIGIAGIFYFFSNNEGFAGLRYSFDKDWAEGKNWPYTGHKMSASLLFPFLEKFKLNLNAETFLQRFDNTNTIFNKKRKDEVYTISSLLSYEFYKNTELQLRYTYVNDRSNIKLYEYTRDVVSAAIQYKF